MKCGIPRRTNQRSTAARASGVSSATGTSAAARRRTFERAGAVIRGSLSRHACCRRPSRLGGVSDGLRELPPRDAETLDAAVVAQATKHPMRVVTRAVAAEVAAWSPDVAERVRTLFD